MPRNATNANWYLPLVAGTELVSRSGALTTFPADGILGDLPGEPCAPPHLVLWLDSQAPDSVRTVPGSNLVYRWVDLSGQGNTAYQSNPDLRPSTDGGGVDFT